MILELTRVKDNKKYYYKNFNELIQIIQVSDTCNDMDDIIKFLDKYKLKLEIHDNIKYSDIC